MSGIFKAYDIRGIYPNEINAEIAESIGRAYIEFTGAKKVVVGRDMRPHSEPLFLGLAKGMMAQGADVIDLGLSSTPQSYFANGTLKADGSVMITASHNPGEWNGFKLCIANAVPISGATGIMDIQKIVEEKSWIISKRSEELLHTLLIIIVRSLSLRPLVNCLESQTILQKIITLTSRKLFYW